MFPWCKDYSKTFCYAHYKLYCAWMDLLKELYEAIFGGQNDIKGR